MKIWHAAALALLVSLPAYAETAGPGPLGYATPQPSVSAERHMAVTAHPLATRAAREVLREGGGAVDATVAAQMVLGLVEPQSSGLGGGAFLMHYDAGTGEVTSWDGRETAPAAATPERFLDDEGEPRPWPEMVPGGLSVGVPGMLRMVHAVHERHGRLPWARLFEDAIVLAREGFGVSPRLAAALAAMGPDGLSPEARDYFLDDAGTPPAMGDVLRNRAYAEALERIAAQGPAALHDGEIAQAIVEAVNGAWVNPGDMTVDDVADYAAVERPAVCAAYRAFEVCGMGPPSSGGLAVQMTLALLEDHDLGDAPTPEALHVIGAALDLAFADRDRYVADADFVAVPEGLLDPAYIAERAELIDAGAAAGPFDPGVPPGADDPGADGTVEGGGTSHVSIVDGDGNAVSMTSSIESAFGARLMAHGFLLNNELTDFAFAPVDGEGRPVANRVEAGKRPRSSMAPTIVTGPDGELRMAVGSPGGPRIIAFVVKAIVAHVDWGLDAQAAAHAFNFASHNGPLEIEDLAGAGAWIAALEEFGHEADAVALTSGLGIVVARDGALEGAADPRRDGAALGD